MGQIPDWAVYAMGLGAGLALGAGLFFILPFPFWLIPVVIGLVVAGIIHQMRLHARLIAAFEKLCQKHGWTFREDDHEEHRRYGNMGPYGTGKGRTTNFLITSRGGWRAMEYEYYVKNKDDKTYYRFNVIAKKMPVAGDLHIKTEHLGHKVWDAVGGSDIDFESHEFSKRYWVTGKDRKFAYDILHPRHMESLLRVPKGWAWDWEGRTLIIHKSGRLKPDLVMPMVQLMEDFDAQIPAHVKTAPSSA